MGRPKQLLEWEGKPLIAYQIEQLHRAGADQVIAVLGHRADEIRGLAAAAGAEVVVNQDYKQGRAGSIRAGALALPESVGAVLILNVDQPRERGVIHTLLAAHLEQKNLISVPLCQGKHGHPVVISGELLPELRGVEEASQGLRAVMRRHDSERREVPIDDPSVLLDLNLPEDYDRARRSQPTS
jgi:molybdenum cofactor cytidylyltransferase